MPSQRRAPAPADAAREGLADRVYRDLLAEIIRGDLQEGDRLSTEQALAERYATSRPTVREALSRLRADGIVVSRQGAGTFVARRPDPDLPHFMPLESLADVRRILEFRIALEAGAAELAASMADEADLAAIEAACSRLETAVGQRDLGVDEDFDFHRAVAQGSKNPFFVSVIGMIQPHMQFGMNMLRNFSLNRPQERAERVQAEHREIVRAIVARDPEAAGQAMRQHLANTRRRMFGS